MGQKTPKGIGLLLQPQIENLEPKTRFYNKSATDQIKNAKDLEILNRWRSSHDWDRSMYDELQQNFPKALEIFQEQLNVPKSNELKQELRKVKDPNYREQLQKYFENMK